MCLKPGVGSGRKIRIFTFLVEKTNEMITVETGYNRDGGIPATS